MKIILQYPRKSKERRQAYSLLRNATNFDLYIQGELRPYRETNEESASLFYPCIYCKGLFKKQYLKRHTKRCLVNKEKICNSKDYVSASQSLAACAMDPTNVISTLNIKEQVLFMLAFLINS